ncbi:histone deacetylase family protein [Rhodovulum sp. FJ3]|uniref:histone deacetylase family protein n=1 Tax=Rhodovulum sp. FJ3 TaxID=3079053 RepID=UPI00293DD658|nr:histone deacetylase family protein [Rhodovulum sp. FJ3]MDV4169048.1 histone deacetylase family protein [Rhodovulum sp. FJ3]
MSTAYITHSDCLGHVTPPGHPERVARLESIETRMSDPAFDALIRHEAPRAELNAVHACHPASYADRIAAAIPETGMVMLDSDTHVSPGSLDAALRAVGGNLLAVDLVLSGAVQNAFVATRPPGHHAETETAMGFCLFGNVALAAKHALDHHGLSRVAVVDFDVHHGNGTQDLLWDEDRTLFISTHQMPLYPGTGQASETGAHGNVINIPLPPHSGGSEMRAAVTEQIIPALDAFQPELILLSAGFDAHRDDPLAQLDWDTTDFEWITRRLCEAADRLCQGRVVSTLEGGYDLDALAASVAAHIAVLMEQ